MYPQVASGQKRSNDGKGEHNRVLRLSGHGGIRHTNDYHTCKSILGVLFRWYLVLLTYDIVWISAEPPSLHDIADS
jgi:hypothetical protein